MAPRRRVICASGALADGGRGVRFALAEGAAEDKAFAIRHAGTVHAFANSCPHLGSELDWQPGEFFEDGGVYLICSTHGAMFEPASGRCIAGPCRGAYLLPVRIEEVEGQVLFIDQSAAPPAEKPDSSP